MKKNKRGFTLVELLAVIILLGIISTVAVVSFNTMQEKSKKEYYNSQRELIVLAAKDYFTTNRGKLPKEIGTASSVNLKELIDNAYIETIYSYKKAECSKEESNVQVVLSSTGTYNYGTKLVCNDDINSSTDKIPPTITYTTSSKVAKNIEVLIKVKDIGSDLLPWKYTIYKDNNLLKENSGIVVKEEKVILNETGKYYIEIFANDSYGNQRTIKTEDLIVDQIPPKCISESSSLSWTNRDVLLKGKCEDTGGSGCFQETVSKTINSNSNQEVTPGTIKDKAGNETICPNKLVQIDKLAPTLQIPTGTINIGANNYYDLMSGVSAYDTGGSGMKNIVITSNGKEITNVNQLGSGTHTISYQAIDNATNSTTKTLTIKIISALSYLKQQENVYIRYGSQLFVTYRDYGGTGYKAILENVYTQTSFSRMSCCDTGVCSYENNNFTNNYIGTVLNNFLATLPNTYTTNLIYAGWNTGYDILNDQFQIVESHENARQATSYVGLMDINDFSYTITDYAIPYIWESVNGKAFWSSNLAYRTNGAINATALIYVNPYRGNYPFWRLYDAANVNQIWTSDNYFVNVPTYARPVVVFNKDAIVSSGDGTKTNPFVIN